MRLNWNNIGKGLEGIAEAKKASDLARESAKYDVTEGAYGPGLQENIQQLEGLKAQDPAQAEAYDQAISELTRRQGLTAPDYSVASGPTNFTSRQEARQAAAPMRAEGLAGVYRRYGDVEKADALETRAYEQQRAIAAEERAKTAEGRAAQEFATRQTETGLRINQLTRTEAEQQRASDFSNFAADNPNLTVNELKDAAFKQFKFNPKQWQDTVATRLQIETGEMDIFKNSIKKKLQGKNLTQLGSLYNSDPDFDDKTDLAIVPGKGGAVTLNFIDKATKAITGTQTFKNESLATEYLNKQATEPETIGSWMMNLRSKEADITAKEASATKDKALGGLYAQGGAGAGKGGLKQKVADFKEVYGRDPTEAEKGVLAGLVAKDSNKPEFTPKDYALTVKSFTESGLSLPAARAEADILYGRGPAASNIDAGLQKANAAKGAGSSAAPIEVQPGERYITAPGAAVRAPLDQFLRESRRGLFGGVEYFYTDPVTGRRYTTEQYNQLQTK